MQKLNIIEVNKKRKPAPIFKGLPEALKDVKNYKKTEKKLKTILKTDHVHKTASSYVKCAECNKKREERQKLMKEIGFKSYAQYLEWKKIMTIISDKKSFQLR